MARHSKIVLKSAGVRALLTGPEVRRMLEAKAQAIADAAGDGYEVERYGGFGSAGVISSTVGATRARATVRTATVEAMYREAGSDSRLLRSLSAGRG